MELTTTPRDEAYDAIVIGAGLGGVSAGAFLAKAGKKVLVVDRLDGPGGYAHAFRRGPYLFDPAIHATGQADPGGRFDLMLEHLGIRDRVDFLKVDPFYSAVLPDFKLDAPLGLESFLDAHGARFPDQASGLRDLFAVCTRVFYELQQLEARQTPAGLAAGLDDAVARYPTLFGYFRATVDDVLDEFLTDPRARATVTAMWPYLGLPPAHVAFLPWAGMMVSYLLGGQFYCKGSFQTLVDAIVHALTADGGELVVRNQVQRITVRDGRAAGVVLADGREVSAPIVVSNVDARQTFERLVGPEHLPPRFMRRLGRLRQSLSAFLVYSATTADVAASGLAHEAFIYPGWDHEETYRGMLSGNPDGMAICACMPTMADPSLAPPGEHVVTAVALVPYDVGRPWTEVKESFTEAMVAGLDRALPGYRDGLTHLESATPHALERYSLNHKGAIYGWDNTPQQAGSRRLRHETPLEGLYLSGHWTQPGTGSSRVVYSGAQAAQAALGFEHVGELIPQLHDHYDAGLAPVHA